MSSRLPKPSRTPLSTLQKPLEPKVENISNINPARGLAYGRLKRRSKSVSDLRSFMVKHDEPKHSRPLKHITQSGVSKTTTTSGAKKRSAEKPTDSDGPTKPKTAKKIPDWDYKSRFNALNEKHSNLQANLKDLKLKLTSYGTIEEDYKSAVVTIHDLQKVKADLTTKYNNLTKENFELLSSNTRYKSDLTSLEVEHNNLKTKFEDICNLHQELKTKDENNTKEIEQLQKHKEDLCETLKNLENEHSELVEKYETLHKSYENYVAKNKDLNETLERISKRNEFIEQKLSQVEKELCNQQLERRVLHNMIQDLKGNIRVICRVRPPTNEAEKDRLPCYINFIDENALEIRKTKESINQITGKMSDQRGEFTFDRVFAPESTQQEVFEDLSQLVQSALDGYHVCVFAYGQTGSGKTYTMQGGDDSSQKGMIPRTVDLIFERIAHLKRAGWEYIIEASFLEIYNENIHDLLNINTSQKLDIYYNEGRGTTVTNLTIQPMSSAEELKEYMMVAHKNRATAATNFNEHSSRSHAVTKIYLQGTQKEMNIVYMGSINLVDLAGSESAKTSTAERLVETKNINKSLSTLGDVMLALHNKNKHVPYRNSKLTYLLQSCLGGNSKTLMFVNVSPFDECFGESLNSLRFASKVKEVKTGSKRNKKMLTN